MALVDMNLTELETLLSKSAAEAVFRLIFENPSLEAPKGSGDWLDKLAATPGQRALYLFASFDGQILNGGLAQYLHNRIHDLHDLLGVLSQFEWPELEAQLDKALNALPADFLEGLAALYKREGDFRQADDVSASLQTYADWESQIDDEVFNHWFYENEQAKEERVAAFVRRLNRYFITS